MCLKQTFLARTKLGECKEGLWVIPQNAPRGYGPGTIAKQR